MLVERALADADIVSALQRARTVDVLAVGKAARPMASAFSAASSIPVRTVVVVGLGDAGHPIPDDRSIVAARRALGMASAIGPDDLLVVLLSGGASALMAAPSGHLPLEAKQGAVRALLARGADITELNTVRKHLSAIKGGHLSAVCGGSILTLAISDVVGDDLSLIGSGPTVADPSTYQDALAVLDARGGRHSYPPEVVSVLEHGAAGQGPETPKPGAPWFTRSFARVIGSAADAVRGARTLAESRGYHVRAIEQPVIGEARAIAETYAAQVAALAAEAPRPLCVLSSGETTVHVTGAGTGGRNQELALALSLLVERIGTAVAFASVGTDGVDGPTDAAGAIIDTTTLARAHEKGLAPERYLADNNAYEFFHNLGDLVMLGPTNTNVGDVQVVLIG